VPPPATSHPLAGILVQCANIIRLAGRPPRPSQTPTMSGSASGESNPTPKKRRTSTARQEQKEVSSLARGLCSVQTQRHEQDMDYIISRLRGEDSDMVVIIATLMKSGSLRKALQDSTTASDDKKGRQLAPSADNLRSIRDVCMKACLIKFEPEIFTKQLLNDVSKDQLLNLLAIGLQAKPGAKLPREHPILRYEGPLLEYLLACYVAGGKKLQRFDPKKMAEGEPYGLFSLCDNALTCLVLPGVTLELEAFKSAADWEVVDPWKWDAKAVSKSQSMSIGLCQAFANAGYALGEQASKIKAEPEALPAALKLLLLDGGVGAALSPLHNRSGQASLPAGSGTVQAPARAEEA